MSNSIRYYSLDEAREEIKKRWNDVELKKRIEEILKDKILPELLDGPRSVICRPIATPDNGFDFFVHMSHYINLKPLVIEYLDDKYVVLNEEKRGLTKIRLINDKKEKDYIDIVDSNKEQGKKLSEVITKIDNISLVDFHHKLLKEAYPEIIPIDKSTWFKSFDGPSEYYFNYLLNFVAHGVYFELLDTTNSDRENSFVGKNVLPNIQKIKELTGLDPIIVKLYPDNQTEEEDFYWFSYDLDSINDLLLLKIN